MRARILHILPCSVALIAGALDTAAGQAVVKGRVLADSTRLPLQGAEVLIPELDRTAVTDAAGAFRLDRLPLGTYMLRVRRIGFRPGDVRLTIDAADSVLLEISLPASVLELEPLLAVGKIRNDSRLDEIYRRHLALNSRLLTPQLLRKSHHRTLASLLEEQGVQIRRGLEGFIPFSRRGDCPMGVFYNGMPQSVTNLNLYPVVGIEAVEVFTSVAWVPIQYGFSTDAECGVVLIWGR